MLSFVVFLPDKLVHFLCLKPGLAGDWRRLLVSWLSTWRSTRRVRDCFLQGEVAGFHNTLIVTVHKAEVTASVQREQVIICSSICNISWTLILISIARCLNFPRYGLCNSLCGFSYYAMHYVILVLILLMLRQHEVFRASAYMMKTAYCRYISTNLGRPCLYRSALYWHWYHRAYACAPCSLGVVLFLCTRVCGGS